MAKTKSNTASLLRIVPALSARTQFGQILKRVKQNKERFVVDKRGEAQAIIISIEEYIRVFGKPITVVEELRAEAKAKGLDRLTLRNINKEIRLARKTRQRLISK